MGVYIFEQDDEPWKDPNKWVTQVETLEAENKRLREALKSIIDRGDRHANYRNVDMQNIAVKALKGDE